MSILADWSRDSVALRTPVPHDHALFTSNCSWSAMAGLETPHSCGQVRSLTSRLATHSTLYSTSIVLRVQRAFPDMKVSPRKVRLHWGRPQLIFACRRAKSCRGKVAKVAWLPKLVLMRQLRSGSGVLENLSCRDCLSYLLVLPFTDSVAPVNSPPHCTWYVCLMACKAKSS